MSSDGSPKEVGAKRKRANLTQGLGGGLEGDLVGGDSVVKAAARPPHSTKGELRHEHLGELHQTNSKKFLLTAFCCCMRRWTLHSANPKSLRLPSTSTSAPRR